MALACDARSHSHTATQPHSHTATHTHTHKHTHTNGQSGRVYGASHQRRAPTFALPIAASSAVQDGVHTSSVSERTFDTWTPMLR